MKPWVDRIALAALLALAALVAGRAWLHQHPEHNPWAPLDLSDPPGWATARKLARLRSDPEECRATLRRSGVEFTELPPLEGGQCPRPDRVVLATEAVALRPARPDATCAVEAGLLLWLRNGVQPAAREFLNSEVAAIEHYGTHACRRRYGRQDTPWSEHASGNAIDVAGFVLADGRRISVRNDWAVGRNRGAFLHHVHESACGAFGTVLGPDYNAAHADHFHLDQAGRLGWSLCRQAAKGFYVFLLIEPPIHSVYLVRVAEIGVADHNQRAQERSRVMLMVAVRFAGDPHVHKLRARDIAAGGVRLAFRGDAIPGDAVTVEFAAIGMVPGVVAWVAGGEIGVRFAEAIDPEKARLPVTGDFRSSIPRHAHPALRRI